MGLLDDTFYELSADLLHTFGSGFLSIVVKDRTYDPRTGIETNNDQTKTVRAMPKPVSAEDSLPEAIKARAEIVFLVASKDVEEAGFTMSVADTVTYGSDSYTILNIAAVYSGDSKAMLKVYCVRS